MKLPEPRTAAIFAAVRKYDELLEKWAAADDQEERGKTQIAEAQEVKKSLYPHFTDCEAMARVFDFDLQAEWKAHLRGKNPLFPGFIEEGPAIPQGIATAVLAASQPRTIREHVLNAARQAWPGAVRAAVLRQKLKAEFGIDTHEKTIGMTLYRLLKDGFLRRNRHDWFFVPEAERPAAVSTDGRKNSGDQPESVNSAENGGGQ